MSSKFYLQTAKKMGGIFFLSKWTHGLLSVKNPMSLGKFNQGELWGPMMKLCPVLKRLQTFLDTIEAWSNHLRTFGDVQTRVMNIFSQWHLGLQTHLSYGQPSASWLSRWLLSVCFSTTVNSSIHVMSWKIPPAIPSEVCVHVRPISSHLCLGDLGGKWLLKSQMQAWVGKRKILNLPEKGGGGIFTK